MEVPEFQVAYREAHRAAAATTLLKVMLDQGTPASVKVRAAECSKAIEIEDVEFRVAELDRAVESREANESGIGEGQGTCTPEA